MENRSVIKQNNASSNNTEVTRKLGESWKGLTEVQKKKYVALAEKDKERYLNEMESYVPTEKYEVKKTTRSKKVNDGPKKPLTAYIFFCNQNRENVKKTKPDLKPKEILSELGKRWKALSEKEKVPYLEQQTKDKVRYQTETNSGDVSPVSVTEKLKSKTEPVEKTKKETKSKKETKFEETPGFKYFRTEQQEQVQEENPKWTAKKVNDHIVAAWQEMDASDREAYDFEANTEDEE